jgi:hypothetical protein
MDVDAVDHAGHGDEHADGDQIVVLVAVFVPPVGVASGMAVGDRGQQQCGVRGGEAERVQVGRRVHAGALFPGEQVGAREEGVAAGQLQDGDGDGAYLPLATSYELRRAGRAARSAARASSSAAQCA